MVTKASVCGGGSIRRGVVRTSSDLSEESRSCGVGLVSAVGAVRDSRAELVGGAGVGGLEGVRQASIRMVEGMLRESGAVASGEGVSVAEVGGLEVGTGGNTGSGLPGVSGEVDESKRVGRRRRGKVRGGVVGDGGGGRLPGELSGGAPVVSPPSGLSGLLPGGIEVKGALERLRRHRSVSVRECDGGGMNEEVWESRCALVLQHRSNGFTMSEISQMLDVRVSDVYRMYLWCLGKSDLAVKDHVEELLLLNGVLLEGVIDDALTPRVCGDNVLRKIEPVSVRMARELLDQRMSFLRAVVEVGEFRGLRGSVGHGGRSGNEKVSATQVNVVVGGENRSVRVSGGDGGGESLDLDSCEVGSRETAERLELLRKVRAKRGGGLVEALEVMRGGGGESGSKV